MLIEDDDGLRRLLTAARTIAVLGASSDPGRASHGVSRYLRDAGYRVIPVNPREREILGLPTVPDLAAAAQLQPIDIVDVFRRSDQVAAHVEEAIAVGAKAIWLQLGVIDHAAARRAHEAGLAVVMDRCILIEHRRLIRRG